MRVFFDLEEGSGTLCHLLEVVGEWGWNVVWMEERMGVEGRGNVRVCVSRRGMDENMDLVMKKLRKLELVEKVEIVGSGG